ncbi:MAG: hypothetical protein V2A62_04120 [Candidatus Woesearchaeota archaeon]
MVYEGTIDGKFSVMVPGDNGVIHCWGSEIRFLTFGSYNDVRLDPIQSNHAVHTPSSTVHDSKLPLLAAAGYRLETIPAQYFWKEVTPS